MKVNWTIRGKCCRHRERERLKGVPSDVYQAAKAGARVVYVRSTKTVYWHIGDMTDGTYSASGHEISFPVKYADYHKSTAGQDQAIESNTVQKLTYVTTKNPEQVVSKSMETPSIIFNRQDKPGVTINKTVSGASFQKDQSYRFVYSEKKQSGGKITDYIGEINVTVKAGETTGSAAISVWLRESIIFMRWIRRIGRFHRR